MATYSIISIQFTQELNIGQQVGFDINTYSTIGSPTSYPMIENVVSTRSASNQMTKATSSTSIVGEQTAINYLAAVSADLGTGFIYSRVGNTVSIKINATAYGYIEFYVNGSFASYTNPTSVIFSIENESSYFAIANVSYQTASETPCDNVLVNVTTTGPVDNAVATEILEPFVVANTDNPFSFTWNRNSTFPLVVKNAQGVTASTSVTTPSYLSNDDFSFDILYDVLSITHVGATGLSLQYSLDGTTWQTGNTFSGVTSSYTCFVKDQFGCSFSNSETSVIDKDDFILARSPYYVTYNAPASAFDYCTVEVFLWTGNNITPSTPNYTLTAYKAKSTDDFVWFELSDYIKSFLNPKLDTTWYSNFGITADSTIITADSTGLTADTNYLTVSGINAFNEVCWARFIIRSYKLTLGVGLLYETIQSPLKVATLGYGFHTEGNNPKPPTNVLIDPVDKYSTNTSINYNTSIRATASNTNNIIERNLVETNYKIFSNGHRELQILYLNKFGVWDSMLFNRVAKRSSEIKSETSQFYQRRPDNYSIYAPTTRTSNINVTEEWILNTELLNERQNWYIEELINSDRWYLLNQEEFSLIPVVLDEKRFDEKLGIYEKAKIQWTLKFKSANSKINDIR